MREMLGGTSECVIAIEASLLPSKSLIGGFLYWLLVIMQFRSEINYITLNV